MSVQTQGDMKAVFMTQYKKANFGNIQTPKSKDLMFGQVIIKVHAVSLNPIDHKILDGKWKPAAGKPSSKNPAVLGQDISGTISSIGNGVKYFDVGDEVFGISWSGALASHRICYADSLCKKPKELSHGEAAALVTAGLTAMQMLERAKMNSARFNKVFISAGCGGVGHFALQLAKRVFSVGEIITTVSTGKMELAGELGATKVLDYTESGFALGKRLKEIGLENLDSALDNVGNVSECQQCVNQNKDEASSVVTILGLPTGAMLKEVAIKHHLPKFSILLLGLLNLKTKIKYRGPVIVENIIMLPIPEDLAKLSSFAVDKKIKVVIDRIYPLEEAIAGLEYLREGHGSGKVLVEVVAGSCANLIPRNPL